MKKQNHNCRNPECHTSRAFAVDYEISKKGFIIYTMMCPYCDEVWPLVEPTIPLGDSSETHTQKTLAGVGK